MAEKADVVIAGGGIGGVVLADLLGRAGRHVVVLEKSTGPPPWVRPEILWPATMEVLLALRPPSFWQAEQCFMPLRAIERVAGDRVYPLLTPEALEAAGVQPVSAEPNRLREALLRTAEADIRRGVEVTGLLRRDGRTAGLAGRRIADNLACEIEARWTVADDGMHSKVRAEAGIEIELRSFPVDFLVRGLVLPAGLADDVGRIFSAPREESGLRVCGLLPQGGGRGAAVALVDEQEKDPGRLAVQWQRFTDANPQLPEELAHADFPGSFARIHRVFGHAARYGHESVILLGDALHPVSPAGGQGANMAVADATVLARLILDGERDIIDRYEALRRPGNNRSLRFTRLAARFLSAPATGLSRAAGAAALAILTDHPKLMAWPLRRISTAFATDDHS